MQEIASDMSMQGVRMCAPHRAQVRVIETLHQLDDCGPASKQSRSEVGTVVTESGHSAQ